VKGGAGHYVTLIASLPDLGGLFRETQTPMSRFRLDQRLAALRPADADRLAAIESLLQWSHLSMQLRDSDMVRKARDLFAVLREPTLVEIVRFRLEMRMLVAALRWRSRSASQPDGALDIVPLSALVRRRWDEEAFGLAGLHPWLPQAAHLLAGGEALAVERLLLERAWHHHGRLQVGHYFDFVAVVIYVLRWNMVARWSRMSSQGARDRFLRLVAAGRGDQAARGLRSPDAVPEVGS
jgi:hypothetical protein